MTTLKAGSIVTCENGHYVCTVMKDLKYGQMAWGDYLGRFEHGKPTEEWGGWNACKQCGALWVRLPEGKFCWETHVNGEWV